MNRFGFSSIGRKLTLVICLVITLGLALVVYFYAQQQEKNILLQNERATHQILDSVSAGLHSVMITGSADVADMYAEKLKGIKDIVDFRILRRNGLEAFRDNATIHEVNEFRKDADFQPRPSEETVQVLPASDPNLKQALLTQQFAYFYNTHEGKERLTFLLPIKNVKKCNRCHGKDKPVLGVLKFTSSLDSVRETVRQTWLQAGGVLLIVLTAVLLVTTAVLKHYIIHPIEVVSRAMAQVSKGDLSQQIPVLGRDELSLMARSFNRMTLELRESYEGFNSEHNKLETIIMGTAEGIVVTNAEGAIALVNPAAETLLDKSAERIVDEGFLRLLDDPERMEKSLEAPDSGERRTQVILHNHRFLAVHASTICGADSRVLGHAAVIRDMTHAKRLEQMLLELSNTDPLTGLLNRRALDATLKAEFELAAEQGRELSILMFDVDHFKKFNDTYGHDQGDRVLKAFSATTLECVRDALDSVCRYGGEEFMVIARETAREGAIVLAERIREAIEQMSVDGLAVTTSVGVASLREAAATTPAELTERADAALYAAKRAGRNRVVVAKPENT